MSEARVVQQMRQHVAESVMMARTAGHADTIYLPDVLEVIDTLTQRAEAAEAERDALRKDAARLREAIDIFISFQGSTREPEGQAALDAALAVQPTTGDKHE